MSNIHPILGTGNSYLVERDDHCVLIDTGYQRNANKIINTIRSSCSDKPLKFIFLTHAHPDHTGGLATLGVFFGPSIVCHEAEKEYVVGIKKYRPKVDNFLQRIFFFFSALAPVPSYTVDRVVSDAEVFDGFRVHHVPGHTPGSIILEDLQNHVIFTGDALLSNKQGEKLKAPSSIFSVDPKSALTNVVKLLSILKPKAIFPGHGKPIYEPDKPIKAFLERFDKK